MNIVDIMEERAADIINCPPMVPITGFTPMREYDG